MLIIPCNKKAVDSSSLEIDDNQVIGDAGVHLHPDVLAMIELREASKAAQTETLDSLPVHGL